MRISDWSSDVCSSDLYEFDHVTGERSFSPELRKIFGLGPHTRLTGDQLVNYVHPEDRERVTATIPIARDPKGAGRNAFECRVVRSDGDVRWVQMRSQTFFAGEGGDRKSTRLNSSHYCAYRMPSSA